MNKKKMIKLFSLIISIILVLTAQMNVFALGYNLPEDINVIQDRNSKICDKL